MQKKGNSVTRWTGYAGLAAGILLTLFFFSQLTLSDPFTEFSTIGFSSLFIMLPFFGLHFLKPLPGRLCFRQVLGPISFARLFKIQVIS